MSVKIRGKEKSSPQPPLIEVVEDEQTESYDREMIIALEFAKYQRTAMVCLCLGSSIVHDNDLCSTFMKGQSLDARDRWLINRSYNIAVDCIEKWLEDFPEEKKETEATEKLDKLAECRAFVGGPDQYQALVNYRLSQHLAAEQLATSTVYTATFLFCWSFSRNP